MDKKHPDVILPSKKPKRINVKILQEDEELTTKIIEEEDKEEDQ